MINDAKQREYRTSKDEAKLMAWNFGLLSKMNEKAIYTWVYNRFTFPQIINYHQTNVFI